MLLGRVAMLRVASPVTRVIFSDGQKKNDKKQLDARTRVRNFPECGKV